MNAIPHCLVAALLVALMSGETARAASFPRTSDHDYDPPAPGSYALAVMKPAADGEVLDANGRTMFLRKLTRGRITVISFIYTRCAAAKACPHATGVLNQLHQFSREEHLLAKEMRLISMSFDPANDTPERMAAYSSWAQGRTNAAEWRFITTRSQKELRPILDAYGQVVDRKKNPADPTGPLNHSLRVFLIDRQGRIRNIYSSGTLDPRLILTDVRTLLMEQSKPGTTPMTPAQAARKPGEICSVAFQAKTTARVTDITKYDNYRPLELLLMDAPNEDTDVTPVERAGIVVRIPISSLEPFAATNLDDLARRIEGRHIVVTGQVEVEPREPMVPTCPARKSPLPTRRNSS